MFRKRHLFAIIVGVTLLSASSSPVALGQGFEQDQAEPATTATLGLAGHSWNRREMKIELVLEQESSFDYFETRLGDVLDELRSNYQIPIILDASVTDVDVDEERLITLDLSDVSLRSALTIMLTPMHCSYVVKDEVLYIMSQDAEHEHLYLRVYDCSDLMSHIGEQGSSEKLLDVLRTTINAETWEVSGGPGSVAEIGGKLVINQNSDGHRKVAWLLKALDREFTDR